MVGQTVSHYRILEKLGEGAMGVVYKAEDLRLKRNVAIKFLARASASQEERERFWREAQAAAALTHPNICTIHDIDEAEGQTFLVQTLIEGNTLQELMAAGPLEPRRAAGISLRLARALQAAHEAGIVHRDIKPSNIMITSSGEPVLMDFGIARLPDAAKLTQTGSTIGTAFYMAPEQAKGEATDPRSDLWSLGVVLYEMLAGKRPFEGPHTPAVLYSVCTEDPLPVAQVSDCAPSCSQPFLDRALAKDPGERYGSADLMAGDLASLVKLLEVDETTRRPSELQGVASASFTAPGMPEQPTADKTAVGTRVSRLGPRALWANLIGYLGSARRKLRRLLRSFAKRPGFDRRAIAVLPLRANGGRRVREVAGSIGQALAAELSAYGGLRVVSVAWSESNTAHEAKLLDVQRNLKAGSFLDGEVKASACGYSVGMRLFDPGADEDVWSYSSEWSPAEVCKIHSFAAHQIAAVLGVDIPSSGGGEESQAPPSEVGPSELCRLGRQYLATLAPQAARESMLCFERATERGEDSANAHAGLADSCSLLAFLGAEHPAAIMPKARHAAASASQERNSASAHAAQGTVLSLADWNWSEGDASFRRAIELNPRSADYRWRRIMFALLPVGRFGAALQELHLALDLDNNSARLHTALGLLYLLTNTPQKALSSFRRAVDIEPAADFARFHLAWGYSEMRLYRESMNELYKVVSGSREVFPSLPLLVSVQAAAGLREKALSTFRGLEMAAGKRYVPASGMAQACAAVGLEEFALDWIERAIQERDTTALYLNVSPCFAKLHSSPRFALALRKVGLG